MSSLRVVFAGTPEFGLPSLRALFQAHQVKAVYTQPDRPAGRGRKLQASPVKEWAVENQIPVYQPLNFKDQSAIAELAALKPDVLVVIAYGLILPQAVLDIPKWGCINVHASLLPRWRGASPIQQAILHGDNQSGVTIMQMEKGLDTGPMWLAQTCPILPTDTAGLLHDKLKNLAPEALLSVLEKLPQENFHPQKQNDALATYAQKITKEEAAINWQQSAIVIDRQIRAYNPWPIAYTHYKDQLMRIHSAKLTEITSTKPPGTVLTIDKKGMLVATQDKALLLETIQFPGGRAIAVSDWLNANQASPGFVLG